MYSLQICISLFLFYHCISSEGFVFHRGSDFMTVAKTDAFVDKTMLIKQIFQAGSRLLITAPRKFGKSMNLNMLKTFLSIDSFKNETIRDTFKTLYISKNNISFFSEHFGKYPVVYVNFKAGTTKNFHQALNVYRHAVHKAYLEHQYLQFSKMLSENNRTVSRNWCGGISFKKMKEEDIITGLETLVGMVHEFNFNKKIVVLIDDYDSVISNALLNTPDIFDLDNIISLTSHILSTLINDTEDFVQLAVVTGISYISSIGLSEVDNLKRYYFQGDHPFVKFYGLTESEVASLYVKANLRDSKKRELVKEFYNGYMCIRGNHIYNTYSFLNFLETGKTIIHWDTSDYFWNVTVWIKHKQMAEIFDSLLNNRNVNLNIQRKIYLLDVVYLRKVYSGGNTTTYHDTDILLSHLLEIGLLSYDTIVIDNEIDDDEVKVKLPNLEVHGIIFNNLKKYFNEKCNLPKFQSASYPAFKQDLYNLYNSTKDYCKPIVASFIKDVKEETTRSGV